MGCWTPVQTTGTGGQWQARLLTEDGSRFEVYFDEALLGVVEWSLTGQHNVANALATMAAARHVGVVPEVAIAGLSGFKSVKRRMEKVAEVKGVTIYDDFAHHPTAIATTLDGLRKQIGDAPLIAVIEPRSNSMKLGAHRDGLPGSGDSGRPRVLVRAGQSGLGPGRHGGLVSVPTEVCDSLEAIIAGSRRMLCPVLRWWS